MTAYRLVLEGGAEFGGQMAIADRKALEMAGGLSSPVVIIAAAAAPDHNQRRAGGNGQRWFQGLGAKDVSVSGLIDRASANQAEVADELRQAGLIYLLGGFPGYLAQTLQGSTAWDAILQAWTGWRGDCRQQRRGDGAMRTSLRPASAAVDRRVGFTAGDLLFAPSQHLRTDLGWSLKRPAAWPDLAGRG